MMRRPPQNYGYEPVPQNHDDLEQENERIAEELKNKISNLKSLTIDIGKLKEIFF
jgi:blocked early in transport 1